MEGVFAWYSTPRAGWMRVAAQRGTWHWSRAVFPNPRTANPIGLRHLPEDDLRGQPAQVALLSNAYWQRAFGGDRGVVGRPIWIERGAPSSRRRRSAEFFGLEVGSVPDVWIALSTFGIVFSGPNWPSTTQTSNFLYVAGRLKPGVSIRQAEAALHSRPSFRSTSNAMDLSVHGGAPPRAD